MRGHCSRLLFQPPNRLPSVMYGPHCPPGIQQFFLLDKGKGTRKLSASQRGAARAAGECVPHATALARLPVKTQEAARREPEQSGASAESAVTTHRGPGAQPRHAFGDFRRETKVTRVQGGAPAYRGVQGLYSPRNISLISPTDFPSSRSLRSSSIRSTLSSRR